MNRLLLPTLEEHKKSGGIYRIFDVQSGRAYIGSAVNFNARFKYHHYRLSKKTHPNLIIQSIFNANKSRLYFEPIEKVEPITKENLLEREQVHIDRALECLGKKSILNILLKAGSPLGIKRSEETKRRLSIAQKGKKASDQAKEKMRQAKLGRKLSDEHKRKLSIARQGQKIVRPKGIHNPKIRIFSSDQVRLMRQLKSEGGTYKEICQKFGVSHSGLQKIIYRKTYQDVL